jgi:signal transduction histidine kinase
MNLLSNACKFTQEGIIEVTAWILTTENNSITEELEDNLEKSVLYVSVKDTGTGIPEEEIGKVFS